METKYRWKKNVTLFMSGQLVSLIGSMLVQYAITWHITLSTQSGLMMTIAIICGFVPSFLLSPFAGVWADKYNRKLLIVLSDALIAMVTLIMSILFTFGINYIYLLFIVLSIRSFGQAVHQPSISAVIPQIVPKDKLTKVNGINTGINSLMAIICPLLSAWLLTVTTIDMIFLIDVVTAALAIIILLSFVSLPTNKHNEVNSTNDFFVNMKNGFKYILRNKYLKTFFIFCGIFNFFITPLAFLTPLQIGRIFGKDVWQLAAIEIAFSIGMTLGGALIATWGGFKNRVMTMVFSSFLLGLSTMALGVIPIYRFSFTLQVFNISMNISFFTLYLFIMGIIGIMLPLFNTPAIVMLQEKVDPNYMGRVMSVLGMISTSTMPLGMLIFGPLADIISIEYILIFTGFTFSLIGLTMLKNNAMITAAKVNIKPTEE